ncbi:DMT family transporter [Aureimonas leprariae]|uniref:DMT family transporter n=1 Tax=Plantimonas leprariae TaxID=2615207 RepID=A0A7V7PP88_9HYPH|nr:DMT family transporter [Aureimonas leprariae]KAB0679781.1 DMT family transporter [Aureimonas leprariae]
MTRIQANLVLLLTGAVWGMGFVAQSTAMASVGPWTFTAMRFVLAALTLLPFAVWENRRRGGAPAGAELGGFALCGAALFAGSILQQFGMLTTSVTNSGFLTGLYVVMTPAVAFVLFRQHPHWVVWLAAPVALVGLLLAGGGRLEAIGRGDWLTVVAAATFAVQIVLVGLFAARSHRPFALSFAQFAVCAVAGLAGMLAFEIVDWTAILRVWPNILYGGCVSAGLAFTLQTIGQRWTTASQAAIFLSSEAVFAALFGAIFLGERIPPVGYLGCVLIFAAMLVVELVPARWPSPRRGVHNQAASSEGAAGR